MTPEEGAASAAKELGQVDCSKNEHAAFLAAPAIIERAIHKVVASDSEEWRELATECAEVLDDDLENRPARHSLGRLRARLMTKLREAKER